MNDRATHLDLLRRVSESEEEEAHVRRVLGEPLKLREEDLDAHERYKRAPFAIGATNHIHRFSREYEDEYGLAAARGMVVGICISVALWAAIVLVLLVMGVRL